MRIFVARRRPKRSRSRQEKFGRASYSGSACDSSPPDDRSSSDERGWSATVVRVRGADQAVAITRLAKVASPE
jgi:hypothetical protein